MSDTNYQELFHFIDYFEDDSITFYTETDGFPEYDTRFSLFIEQVYKSGLMREDYLDYLHERIEKSGISDDYVQNADIECACALLTYYVRGERFCDGFWKQAIDHKAFLKVLRRLKELLMYDNFH